MGELHLSNEQLEIILEAIQSIGGTIINIKRYPAGSSIVKMALERGYANFVKSFEFIDSFTLSENERQLLLNDERMPDRIQQRGFVTKFVQSMIERNIRSLTFKKDLTSQELYSFVSILGKNPEELKELLSLTDYLTENGITNITVDEKVFVALTKGQTVADIAELEKLAHLPEGTLTPETFKEGVFVQYLISRLPLGDLNIDHHKLDDLKSKIDYDKVKNASEVDFEKLGPLLAATLERWSQDVESIEGDLVPVVGAKQGMITDEIAANISPDLFKSLASQETALAAEASGTAANERVEKLTRSFEEIAGFIYSFNQPQIRMKLLHDFLKVITNFKAFTLAPLLTTRFSNDLENVFDIKGKILSAIPWQKKGEVAEYYINKYTQIIEGLSPADFEVNLTFIEESEKTLKRIIESAQGHADAPSALLEQAKRGLALSATLRKEASDPEKLLILKVRHLLAKDPLFLLDDKIQVYLSDLIIRLLDYRRLDAAKKILDKLFMNLAHPEVNVRLQVAGTVVRISQSLLDVGNVSLYSHLYSLLLRGFHQESDQRVYAALLASMIADLGRFIETRNTQLVVQIFKNISTLKNLVTDETKQKFILMCEARIVEHQGLENHLIEKFTSDEEKQSEAALQVLNSINPKRVAPIMLNILETSEEMRIRKKALNALSRSPQTTGPLVRQQMQQPNAPWYYLRNLILLVGETKDVEATPLIANHLEHENPQVRKVALSTLIKLGGEAAEKKLAEVLPKLDHPSQRLVFSYLGNAHSKAAIEFMLKKLDPSLPDKDQQFAIELITALGKIGSPEAVPAMKKILRPGIFGGLLKGKTNEKITIATLRALGEIGGKEAQDVIGKFTRHDNAEIARTAQKAMSALSRVPE